ncbi:HPP family protein [Verticiella sediminum]|uniref:HPP family protein n=1 Tax=Verticiella sediminum TaxID=1247510 RepID=A0A556AC63_9BURK|nr:HPP family protein [Verticiella sediminum]TSH90479.1 HPP family protein [Verticiella sediminum]
MMARVFVPILAGATLRERSIACLGALLCVCLTAWLCGHMLGDGLRVSMLTASLGASALLLVTVPASPLAQPWPIIGGNTLSAVTGLAVGAVVHDPVLASGIAVASAIAVMSLTRSLHPPGGATALSAALGGSAVDSWGLLYPLVPVAINGCVLVCLGVLFHRLRKHAYPHVAPPPPANMHATSDLPPMLRVGFREEDISTALERLNETFDIDRDDLARLLREIELRAMVRTHATLSCGDIMSRDVVSVGPATSREHAHRLLLRHNLRLLPVLDEAHRLLGTVGLRELAASEGEIISTLSEARTTRPQSAALELLPVLTDGRTHAVVVLDDEARVVGIISQTDLLGVLGRMAGSYPACSRGMV